MGMGGGGSECRDAQTASGRALKVSLRSVACIVGNIGNPCRIANKRGL